MPAHKRYHTIVPAPDPLKEVLYNKKETTPEQDKRFFCRRKQEGVESLKKGFQRTAAGFLAVMLLTAAFLMGSMGKSLAVLAAPEEKEGKEIYLVGQTGQGSDEYMGDAMDVYWVDASVQLPDDYTNIVGFELTVKVKELDNYGGGKETGEFECGMILASKGANAPKDYVFTYPNAQTPEYDLSTKNVTAFGFGDAGWLVSMAFSPAVKGDADVKAGDTITLRYEGNNAIFSENDPVMTLVSFLGQYEYESISWITGAPTQVEEEPWEKVDVKEYMDVPTVSEGVQNGSNYVDITVPDTGKASYPVILWIHGGGYITGDRKSCLLSDTKQYLLAQGYAFVSAEYTLTGSNADKSREAVSVSGETTYTTAGMPQMLYDVKAAVRFLRANAQKYQLNTDFIAAMGESAGAGLALLLGTSNGMEEYEDLSMGNADYSSDVQAMISICGPTEFTGEYAGNLLALFGEEIYSWSPEKLEEMGEKYSPTELVHSESPAMYLACSKTDTTVPPQMLTDMRDMARMFMDEEDVRVALYETGGHVDRTVMDNYTAYVSYADFLNEQKAKYIKDDAADKDTEENGGKADAQSGWTAAAVVLAVVLAGAVIIKKKKNSREEKKDEKENNRK